MGLYTIEARRRFDKRPRRSNTNFRKNRSSMFERERIFIKFTDCTDDRLRGGGRFSSSLKPRRNVNDSIIGIGKYLTARREKYEIGRMGRQR